MSSMWHRTAGVISAVALAAAGVQAGWGQPAGNGHGAVHRVLGSGEGPAYAAAAPGSGEGPAVVG